MQNPVYKASTSFFGLFGGISLRIIMNYGKVTPGVPARIASGFWEAHTQAMLLLVMSVSVVGAYLISVVFVPLS